MNLKKLAGVLILAITVALILCVAWLNCGYLKARQPDSYLPDSRQFVLNLPNAVSGRDTFLIKTYFYLLSISPEGDVEITSPEGLPIFSNIRYFSSCEGYKDTFGLQNVSIKKINDSTCLISGNSLSGTMVDITVTAESKLPKIDFRINTRYVNDVTVNRESLVVKYKIPVTEILKKNGKSDTQQFSSEYWLGKQGVRFGEALHSALIYHTPGISSLQLNLADSLLFINLDYSKDHPFINIPYQADGQGRWTDCSPSRYHSYAEKTDSVSFYVGYLPAAIPRIMMLPDGYVAGHVFTEHADGGEKIESQLAAYFGSDSITDIKNAYGGFAGHRIPVTKSVMYCDSTGKLSDPCTGEASGWNRKASFLDQLNETGLYDICLHTPEDMTSDRRTLSEAIPFMKQRYNTRSWIDHGMFNGKINRECFVCDGLNPVSEFYAGDLWKENDTRYFWNSAVEQIRSKSRISVIDQLRKLKLLKASEALWDNHLSSRQLTDMKPYQAFIQLFKSIADPGIEMNSFFPDKGDSYPTPLYWQNKAYSGDFYSWVTDYVQDYRYLESHGAEKALEKDKNQFDQLISDWGIFIEHGYYVRDHDVITEYDGHLRINPYFDELLSYLQDNQEKGTIYNTTVRELLDYWILSENISFTYFPDGTINLFNNNDKGIEGLSLAVRAESVLVDGVKPSSRRYNDDLVFWFDIPAMTSKKITLE